MTAYGTYLGLNGTECEFHDDISLCGLQCDRFIGAECRKKAALALVAAQFRDTW